MRFDNARVPFSFIVIPAKAGIHLWACIGVDMDSRFRFRGNDDEG
jgi:hypothetical protein